MTFKLRDIKWLKATQLKSQVKGKDDDNYEIYLMFELSWKCTGEFSWEFDWVEYFFGQQTWAQMSEGFKKIFSAQFCK